VDEEYIRDTFNLYGLKQKVKNYNEAMKMTLSEESPESEDFNDAKFLALYE
jgi:casein kinase II subunit beta